MVDAVESQIRQRIAEHHPGCNLNQRHSHGLADERDRPAGAQVGLQDIEAGAVVDELKIQETMHAQRAGQPGRDVQDAGGCAF